MQGVSLLQTTTYQVRHKLGFHLPHRLWCKTGIATRHRINRCGVKSSTDLEKPFHLSKKPSFHYNKSLQIDHYSLVLNNFFFIADNTKYFFSLLLNVFNLET